MSSVELAYQVLRKAINDLPPDTFQKEFNVFLLDGLMIFIDRHSVDSKQPKESLE